MIRSVESSAWFQAADKPYLLVDGELRIDAVNAAYEAATGQPSDSLIGEWIFETLPDSPADPHGGAANLSASFEHVLRHGLRHWMGIQRYDVPGSDEGGFVYEQWVPVNSPLVHDGRVVGAIHHVEDVTDIVDGDGRDRVEMALSARALATRFPTLGYYQVRSAGIRRGRAPGSRQVPLDGVSSSAGRKAPSTRRGTTDSASRSAARRTSEASPASAGSTTTRAACRLDTARAPPIPHSKRTPARPCEKRVMPAAATPPTRPAAVGHQGDEGVVDRPEHRPVASSPRHASCSARGGPSSSVEPSWRLPAPWHPGGTGRLRRASSAP